jgi:hypothetical protein
VSADDPKLTFRRNVACWQSSLRGPRAKATFDKIFVEQFCRTGASTGPTNRPALHCMDADIARQVQQ